MSDKLELGFDFDALINKGKKFNSVKSEFLKEGDSFYRLIPPANSSQNRQLNHKWVTHWLTGSNGKKIQVACTYFTEKYCPLCAVAKEIQAQIDRITDGGNRKPENLSEDEKNEVKRLWEGKKQYEATRSFAYLTLNASNEVVVLKLSSTVSQLLDKKVFQAVTEYGFDPTSVVGGVWFKFSKVGKGRDSVTVDFKRVVTKVNGKIQEELDQSAIPEDALNRLNSSRPDIHSHKDMWVKEYSAAQLGAFLKGIPLDGQGEEGKQASLNLSSSINTSSPSSEAILQSMVQNSAVSKLFDAQQNDENEEDDLNPPFELDVQKSAPSKPLPTVSPKETNSVYDSAPQTTVSSQATSQSNTLAEQIARMRQLTSKK